MTPSYLIKKKKVTQIINNEAVSHTYPSEQAEILYDKLIAKGYPAQIEDVQNDMQS